MILDNTNLIQIHAHLSTFWHLKVCVVTVATCKNELATLKIFA